MPRLDGAQESLYHGSQEAAHRARSAWEGFTDWVFSDNVLEVAIGLMYVCLQHFEIVMRTARILRTALTLLQHRSSLHSSRDILYF